MKVRNIDGGECVWNLGKYVGSVNNNPSEIHLLTREFLKENYPAIQILEEVYLPGEKLYLDFYLPTLKLAIECQGEQHEKFTPFFHKNKMNFYKSKGRDNRKEEFCKINGIRLVYFYPTESEEQWKKKI